MLTLITIEDATIFIETLDVDAVMTFDNEFILPGESDEYSDSDIYEYLNEFAVIEIEAEALDIERL